VVDPGGSGGVVLQIRHLVRLGRPQTTRARSNQLPPAYTGGRRWVNEDAVTDEDKRLFRFFVEHGMNAGGRPHSPQPPPMSARVERASVRIESRLSRTSATPSPPAIGADGAGTSEGAFSPIGAAAAAQQQLEEAMPRLTRAPEPPPIHPTIVALVRDLKEAVVKLALRRARLERELERQPPQHAVPSKRRCRLARRSGPPAPARRHGAFWRVRLTRAYETWP
jgi:hypothetical protein